MSLAARLLNVFAVPGEVFTEVKASRVCIGNWLVPALLSALVAVLTVVLIVSQPAFQQQMHDLTERAGQGAGPAGQGRQSQAGRCQPRPGSIPGHHAAGHAQGPG